MTFSFREHGMTSSNDCQNALKYMLNLTFKRSLIFQIAIFSRETVWISMENQ